MVLKKTSELFALAHELVNLFPKKELSWFAVGLYYLLTKEFIDARRYLSKATAINPNFGLAWIAFGHSFAMEGEHDSALSIYASVSKIMPGSHHPLLFLGMEHSKMNEWRLAQDYFLVALDINQNDPLLHNELGSVFYGQQKS